MCAAVVVVQARLQLVPDGSCLLSLVEFLYLDDVQQQDVTHPLYVAALQCGLKRLVTRCEAHYAHQLEVQLHSWPGVQHVQRSCALCTGLGTSQQSVWVGVTSSCALRISIGVTAQSHGVGSELASSSPCAEDSNKS
jgi:hypothetical protein